MKSIRVKLQSGISLLEVLLSVSIIAIILVMATKYFFVANDNDRVNVLRQQIGSIVAAIHSWKGQNPKFSSEISYLKLSQEGFLPKSKYCEESQGDGRHVGYCQQMYTPWGRPIVMSPDGNGVNLSAALKSHNECVALQNSYPDGTCDGVTFNLYVS